MMMALVGMQIGITSVSSVRYVHRVHREKCLALKTAIPPLDIQPSSVWTKIDTGYLL